jgi:hypothetical protein
MQTAQLFLNAMVSKLGIERATEVLLEDIKRKSFVAGFTTYPNVKAKRRNLVNASASFEMWNYEDSLKCVPVEATES